MKKILLLVCTLLLAAQLSAAERTPQELRQMAARAITSLSHPAQARSAAATGESLTLAVATDHLCLYTAADGSFAIVTRDDRQPAIIGVGSSAQTLTSHPSPLTSHPSSLTPHPSPPTSPNPSFDWYLQAAEAALSTGKPLRRVAPDTNIYPARVDNLLTTTWSQDEPYKNHTPLMANGDNYVTGCVATSMAQVLAYHRLPLRGQGEASVTSPLGERLTANFGTTLYDRDHMKPSYNYLEHDYTFEEGEAVATLMAHCGVASKMTYNETGSGAFNDDAAQGLQQYFGFKSARNVRRNSYASNEAWMNLIFDELAHHAPIMFGAQSTYGHSFVFAGYDEDGLVYVNWGWGGDKNGWFDVNVLDPDQNGGFVTNQQMIVGIRSYQPDVAAATVTTTEAGTVASLLYVHAANKSVYRSAPYSSFAGTRLFGTLVRATSTTREYGQPNPPFGYTVEGDDITGEPELVCEATPQSPVGVYPIYCRQGTVEGTDVVFQDGSLFVTESQGIDAQRSTSSAQRSASFDLQGRRVRPEKSRSAVIITDGRKRTND